MHFISQKVIKGQAIVDFLAEHLVLECSKHYEDILDEMVEAKVILKESVW